jgi:hypothetical protein
MNYYKAVMEAMAIKSTEANSYKEPPITPPNYEHDEEAEALVCSVCGATKEDDDLIQVTDDDDDVIYCKSCYNDSIHDGDLSADTKHTELK